MTRFVVATPRGITRELFSLPTSPATAPASQLKPTRQPGTFVRPCCAVMWVGLRNWFGQARMEALKRLEGSGGRVYRTDVNGAVTF